MTRKPRAVLIQYGSYPTAVGITAYINVVDKVTKKQIYSVRHNGITDESSAEKYIQDARRWAVSNKYAIDRVEQTKKVVYLTKE